MKLKVGDVFLIPIDAETAADAKQVGIGQLAGDWKGELYIVVYEGAHPKDVSPTVVNQSEPLFAALSLDAKLHHGDWAVIGNVTENLSRLPQPVFKVMQGSATFVESRDRTKTRPAIGTEAEVLRPRTVVAPIRLERALKALHGRADWNAKYDELRADYARRSAAVLD